MNALLVAGTDTDVGKTIVMSALAAYWQTYWSKQRLGILKPIQSGEGDCERYSKLFGLDPAEVTPVRLQSPLAPPIAAEREGSKVAVERAWQAFGQLRHSRDFVLVEGLGGLGSPVTRETTVADLAWDWRLPTVLVVPVKLGAIGQAVANVALARQSRIHLKGIILNCAHPQSEQKIADFAPAKLIESLTNIPVLGTLPHISDLMNVAQLAQAASQLDLERLFPGNLWMFSDQAAG
ncbi:ATP-dependent dethiobiotin synthetase BioD [Phormidium sp. CLA17]|uniref:dethiobiotin synthase n=1 Tax=Leptolyngbya sp. Cla-17 TaxID=2803751 RepID=UPI0014910366|nr:dethiobiotin synthase [Leptolyngbya sp. Cla-17]MBM0742870.1 ATP-dependent dethiobiotin synthetase BioD [Leptolyngbya sp. Cla-17]